MELNLKNLLTFLDDPKCGDNKHSSAVVGVIDEYDAVELADEL